MPNEEGFKRKKGAFTGLSLSISKKYIYPVSRKWMVLLGLVGCFVFSGYFFLDSFLQDNTFISSGPLSSNHANFENDCSNCHIPLSSVSNEKCSRCHESSPSKTEFYSFSAHYKYRANGGARVETASTTFANRESDCYLCHPEHLGRLTPIIDDNDSKCLSCHHFGSFNTGHPEFEFARTKTPDDANLQFTHVNHVIGYIGEKNPEKACNTCHTLAPGGQNFRAINFENHCSDCHGAHRRENFAALRRRNNTCKQCHVMAKARVLPVQEDQRILTRAKFSHAPHVLLRNCLNCHSEIAFSQNMKSSRSPDEARTQNIPRIENCKPCHSQNLTSNRCITCHDFHPNENPRLAVGTL